jgi:hypothetical protein
MRTFVVEWVQCDDIVPGMRVYCRNESGIVTLHVGAKYTVTATKFNASNQFLVQLQELPDRWYFASRFIV